MKLNLIITLALVAFASAAQATDNLYFFKPTKRIGCGTITSVRKVNQLPLYDREFEMAVGGNPTTRDLVYLASFIPGVGVATAVVGSMVADGVIGSSSAVATVSMPPNGVQAVRVVMDDGSVLNLPLTAIPSGSLKPGYEVDRRVEVFLLKDRSSIQLGLAGRAPMATEKLYSAYCSMRTDPEDAAAAVKGAASLVQEDKILN